eukprot:517841-Amphidinium_carterae.1
MEVDEDVAKYAAARPHPQRKKNFSKPGGRRTRRAGMRGTRSDLPSVEDACDAFLAKVWNHPDFDQYADNGRIVFTRTTRSVSEQLAE